MVDPVRKEEDVVQVLICCVSSYIGADDLQQLKYGHANGISMRGKGVPPGTRRQSPSRRLRHLFLQLRLWGLGYGVTTESHLHQGYSETPNVGENGVDCSLESLRLAGEVEWGTK